MAWNLPLNCLTVDVEDWYHILDSDAVPARDQWPLLESRVERNTTRILEVLARRGVKATFFWLGWMAERHQPLVRRCLAEGHEIASHGYAHVLAYQTGRRGFQQDVVRAKTCLEDIAGREILGFRAAGFGIKEATGWAFEVIRAAGHQYDASVFPARRGHGGMRHAPLVPYLIDTPSGGLFEVPMSVVEVLGRRVSLFGGGYLRLAPKAALRWGAGLLAAAGRPLVVYVHPRDIDPQQPRLPLPPLRRFKCYVNLRTGLDKIEWLCENYSFTTMAELMNSSLAARLLEYRVSAGRRQGDAASPAGVAP